MRVSLLLLTMMVAARAAPAAQPFVLMSGEEPVPLLLGAAEAPPVSRAAGDVAEDIATVTGSRPPVLAQWPRDGQALIVVGQVGAGGAVDALIEAGAFDGEALRGEWESFVIEAVDGGAMGAGRVLVVAGSDPRGTVYGLYELSREIGVSPWAWWADVPVREHAEAAVVSERRRIGPPSVKYRGIFLNDEDWAMHPWAAETFDPELGDIGPRTYARVFELLLRLRGNMLWPAMHEVSRPFNADRQNAELADAYGIVMSSSHAEPMLRNNVREWTAPPEDYNYRTNREGVLAYWEERLRTNAGFENIYTLGMRGIHDSGMQGGHSVEDRVALLERIISDQRELLAGYVEGPVEAVPQIFVAYKEVLELYRAGLEVPSDVTIVWPDDNFGYIRDFASPEEQAERTGGFGVYNHVSYLGRPLAYLWLNTTPPALIWEEMAKAYAHGADRFWVLNVGDLKPAEIGIDFFFDLAWEVERWDADTLPEFLPAWAERQFGPEHASSIAEVLTEYYLLNFQRKPEHLEYHLFGQEPAMSPLSDAEIAARLHAFDSLEARAESLGAAMPEDARDAFYQLVGYPVLGSAAANRRYFWTERFRRTPSRQAATEAWEAEERLHELTRIYNEEVAGGKWRHFMALEPADDDWRSMRIAPLKLPPRPEELSGVPEHHPVLEGAAHRHLDLIAADFFRSVAAEDAAWAEVPGLGRSGRAMTILPFAGEPWSADQRPTLVYPIEVPAGIYRLEVELLPTFPLRAGAPLRLAVGTGDEPAETLELRREVQSARWAQGVLSGHLKMETRVELPGPDSELRLEAVDRGVVVDRLRLIPE